MSWQPIETAPKDRPILAVEDDTITAVQFGDTDTWWVVGAHGYYLAPTHWMPLPPAPGEEDKGVPIIAKAY